MSETIFEELRADLTREGGHLREEVQGAEQAAGRAAHRISDRFRHHGYHDRNSAQHVAEGTPMDFDPVTIAADIRNDLQAAEDKAGEVWNHVKSVLEEKLPQVESITAKVGSDPLVKLALDDTIPASIRQIGADLITKLLAAFPPQAAATAPAEGDATASADPAQAPAAVA